MTPVESTMTCKSKTIEFVAFCFEQYKKRHHLDTDQVMDLFEEYDVFSYLQEGYEPLHTQDAAYLMGDIEEFIRNRQEKK
ncbi:MAG: DUF3791 domain-containing protein [Verrucomicrobia bacterium]|nr:DUF3791 domain-containing protein [Verrucomicrobiota bacterium]